VGRLIEKISFEQFKKDIQDDIQLYNDYKTPKRGTKCSAGYDFYAIQPFSIQPGEVMKIPTGCKMKCNEDEMLMIVVRGSMGFKYNVRLCNQVGIVETDYYNNPNNEGHLWVALQNHGEEEFCVKQGQAFAQGIFTKFLTVDNEEIIENERKGGFGSTNGE